MILVEVTKPSTDGTVGVGSMWLLGDYRHQVFDAQAFINRFGSAQQVSGDQVLKLPRQHLTMSDQADLYHQAAGDIEAANRFLRRASAVFCALLLAGSLAVIAWGAATIGGEVNQIKAKQVQFHRDSTCQTAALDQILIELSDAQQAQQHGQPLPRFVYPHPCF